jgi:hypothetical protein
MGRLTFSGRFRLSGYIVTEAYMAFLALIVESNQCEQAFDRCE